MLCFWSFSLALPSPKSAEGTAFGTHTRVNKPKTTHGSIGSHGFKGFGGGHATRKREASPEPLPRSSQGTYYAPLHTGVHKPMRPHGSIGSHGFHGFGGGHGTR